MSGGELPYEPSAVIDEGSDGDPWYLVYDQAEGFQPRTIAVRAPHSSWAVEAWEDNTGREAPETLVVGVIGRRWHYGAGA